MRVHEDKIIWQITQNVNSVTKTDKNLYHQMNKMQHTHANNIQ